MRNWLSNGLVFIAQVRAFRAIAELVTEGSGGSDLSLRPDDLDSIRELYIEDDFRQLVLPTLSAASASLKIMASAVLFERHPLEPTVRRHTVANELLMTFVVRRRFQCSAGEAVEGEQRDAAH
jgi:hypothetical protein